MTGSIPRRVGIVGAGQLGRMLALAAAPLGLRCLFLDRSATAPGAQIAPILVGDLTDPALLADLAKRCDVLTFDWENVPAGALAPLAHTIPIRPGPDALEVSQDRLAEKALFTRLRIPVTPHAAVDGPADLERAARRLGLPGVLKTRRLGYDGKGQVLLRDRADFDRALETLGERDLIYENHQRFSFEVSIVGARGIGGEIALYPLSANTHRDGTLRYGIAPYRDEALERLATSYIRRVMRSLDYVGVLAIEFFVVNGRLLANEMAPRVHNSGHWTIDGCVTSQFENHLRAICGLPLGSTRALGYTAMINFLGSMPDQEALLRIEGLAYHDYGKDPRPGRKLGHCTIVSARAKDRDAAMQNALKSIRWT